MDTKGRWTPHSKLLDKKVTAKHFHAVNEKPFEMVNL